MTNAALAAYKDAGRGLDLLEERRLVYVAVTRARDLVLASGAAWNETVTRPREPSVFLDEVARACAAGVGPVGPWCADPGDSNPFAAAAGRRRLPRRGPTRGGLTRARRRPPPRSAGTWGRPGPRPARR